MINDDEVGIPRHSSIFLSVISEKKTWHPTTNSETTNPDFYFAKLVVYLNLANASDSRFVILGLVVGCQKQDSFYVHATAMRILERLGIQTLF